MGKKYQYLSFVNRNLLFMAISLAIWAIAFYILLGYNNIFLSYVVLVHVLILLCVLQYSGSRRLAAQLFIGASCFSLFVIDDGLIGTPVTGIELLYIANIMYMVAFYMERLFIEYYATILLTVAVFMAVNYTRWAPHLAASVTYNIPGYVRLLILPVATGVVVYRFIVFVRSTMLFLLNTRLEQSELEQLFNNVEEAICLVSRDLRLIRFNPAFVKLFKSIYRSEPNVGVQLPNTGMSSGPGVIPLDIIYRVLDGEILMEEYHIELDDEHKILEVSFLPVLTPEYDIQKIERIGIISRDITTRRRQEMEIVYSQTGLLEMIAHDLKAPLGLIKSVNSMGPDDADGHKKFIAKTSEQALASINNVLAFSRYLGNSNSPGFFNENLHNILSDKIEEMEPYARMHGQELLLDMTYHNLYVKMNKEAFGRAIGNLINNAIKFSPVAGQIRIIVSLPLPERNKVVIKVSDQGVGVAEHLKDHLFTKFTTAGKKGIHGEESFGLGLYISSIILKLHGGKLELDKSQTKGATFVMEVPLLRSNFN